MKKRIIAAAAAVLILISALSVLIVPAVAADSGIPEGYRLLTADDVGKMFGEDLSTEIYIDDSIAPIAGSGDEEGEYLTLLDVDSQFKIRSKNKYIETMRMYDSGYITQVIYDATNSYDAIGSWRKENTEIPPDQSTITYFCELFEWNNWLYVKDIENRKIPEGYRLLTAADVGKTFGVDLFKYVYIDTNVVPLYISAGTSKTLLKAKQGNMFITKSSYIYGYEGTSQKTIYYDKIWRIQTEYVMCINYYGYEISQFYEGQIWNNWLYVRDASTEIKPNTIPEGYRLLNENDVGKTFGIDLENEIFVDNSVHPYYVNKSSEEQIWLWKGTGNITEKNYGSFTRYTNSKYGVLTIQSNYNYREQGINVAYQNIYKSSAWTPLSYLIDSLWSFDNVKIETFNTDLIWNNWLYVKDKDTGQTSNIPEGYRLLTTDDIGKTFGVELEDYIYIDTEVTPNDALFSLPSGCTDLLDSEELGSLIRYWDEPEIGKYISAVDNEFYKDGAWIPFMATAINETSFHPLDFYDFLSKLYTDRDLDYVYSDIGGVEALKQMKYSITISDVYSGVDWNNWLYVKDKTYSISINTTNCTVSGDTTITGGGSAYINVSVKDPYVFPETIRVDEASYDWDPTLGRLTVSNPRDDVVISIVANKCPHVDCDTMTFYTSTGSGGHNVEIKCSICNTVWESKLESCMYGDGCASCYYCLADCPHNDTFESYEAKYDGTHQKVILCNTCQNQVEVFPLEDCDFFECQCSVCHWICNHPTDQISSAYLPTNTGFHTKVYQCNICNNILYEDDYEFCEYEDFICIYCDYVNLQRNENSTCEHYYGDLTTGYVKNNDGTHTPEKYCGVCQQSVYYGEPEDCIFDHGNCSICNFQCSNHDFTGLSTSPEYLVSGSTCDDPAAYYFSCSICGVAGTEIFDTGAKLGHDFVSGVCSRCSALDPDYKENEFASESDSSGIVESGDSTEKKPDNSKKDNILNIDTTLKVLPIVFVAVTVIAIFVMIKSKKMRR